MSKITKIELKPELKQKKKVAAYARVSVETERMNHSLVAQVCHYQNYIQSNPRWEYVGVFADDGVSGTGTEKRNGFKEMVECAARGEIDLILTKSIQRFARNTVDLLETVRFLKSINVEVIFEKENISTLSAKGELMLSILASFAQEESRSISDNIKWGIRKRMEQGCVLNRNKTYGYEWQDGKKVIVPEEAKIIKRIYDDFLEGKNRSLIKRELNAEGLTTVKGNSWDVDAITFILSNPTYTGDTLLQKYITLDPISKHKVRNKGEMPQYYVEDTHAPIVDKGTFEMVQEKLLLIKEEIKETGVTHGVSPFSGKVICEHCGKRFHRTKKTRKAYEDTVTEIRWLCSTSRKGLGKCGCGTITEPELYRETAAVLGMERLDEDIFKEKIEFLSIPAKGIINFHFRDGSVVEHKYSLQKRANHWGHKAIYKGMTCFTSKLKCPHCGSNYKSGTRPVSNGGRKKMWYCQNRCQGFELEDSRLRQMCSEALDFTDERFTRTVEQVEVVSKEELVIYMKNGERRHYGKSNKDTCNG